MRLTQALWTADAGWQGQPLDPNTNVQWALVFGDRHALQDQARITDLRTAFPTAYLLGCSTAGEIYDTQVRDASLVVTGIELEHTGVEQASVRLDEVQGDSFQAGLVLAERFPREGLRHVFVLSDGLGVNGSLLVRGLAEGLGESVSVSGGLSGDASHFQTTLVLDPSGSHSDRIAAVGLYGDRIRIGSASLGGWDSFGPERRITRAEGNVLYELDGEPALTLYKRYLAEHAEGLPATGLLFPMNIRVEGSDRPLTRTILSVDEAEGSLVFAGDVPEGSYGRLMKANFERLVEGAAGAARSSEAAIGDQATQLAILISCVGRKMVLKQRVEEEVEAVREVLGPLATLTGFYSYGEISPFTPSAKCELHNQTMTITTIAEE